jgi:hypothetical protein
MAVKARFLGRTDVPPLPKDAPIDAIAQRLARQIEQRGHLHHWSAVCLVTEKFGRGFTYTETVKDRQRCDPHLQIWLAFGSPRRELLHPEILPALKKLTGKNIVWGKDCREWWLAKGAMPSQPLASDGTDDDEHDGPITPTAA